MQDLPDPAHKTQSCNIFIAMIYQKFYEQKLLKLVHQFDQLLPRTFLFNFAPHDVYWDDDWFFVFAITNTSYCPIVDKPSKIILL